MASPESLRARSDPYNVVAVVGSHVAAFELGVISGVFGVDRSAAGLPTYAFSLCAVQPGPVRTTSGFSVDVTHGLEQLDDADLIIVPFWTDEAEDPPPGLAEALHMAVDRGSRILAICSGAFLVAAVGLLDGRRVATHRLHAPVLARRFPTVVVDDEILYVQDGPVTSAAGTTAAIDACLHIVRQMSGAAVATAIAQRLVAGPHRAGDQAQVIEHSVPVVGEDDMNTLREWVLRHLSESVTVDQLAARVLMSPRTFARRFKTTTGTTPHKWILEQRLLLAEHLIEETDLSMAAIATRCGLGTSDTLRHHFMVRSGLSPTTHRRAFLARGTHTD